MVKSYLLMLCLGANVLFAERGIQEEVLAEKAGKRWKEWSQLWDGQLEPKEIKSQFAEDCRLVSSQPVEKVKLLNGGFEVADFQFIETQVQGGSDVIEALKSRPKHVHVVVTGRDAPEEIVEMADLVSEMKPIKHPFEKGTPAQAGIDF